MSIITVMFAGCESEGIIGSVTWRIENGTLTVMAKGPMPDYSSVDNHVPWYCYRSYIRTVVIGNEVTGIGDYAFAQCDALTSVTLPNSVTGIGFSAFDHCYSLTSAVLGNRVTTVEEWAFSGCYALMSVTSLNPTPPYIRRNVFDGIDLNKATLRVPAESVEAYRAAEVWKEFETVTAYAP
ncbi:MAG: leucine-rich repeat domain-containing protein [Tannerella sp.]|nr:leucine-rich repeat domain-containing protein [Tannerella sp.]